MLKFSYVIRQTIDFWLYIVFRKKKIIFKNSIVFDLWYKNENVINFKFAIHYLKYSQGEICDKILKGLPDEAYEKIRLLNNSTTDKINTNLELVKLLRSTQENSSAAMKTFAS